MIGERCRKNSYSLTWMGHQSQCINGKTAASRKQGRTDDSAASEGYLVRVNVSDNGNRERPRAIMRLEEVLQLHSPNRLDVLTVA